MVIGGPEYYIDDTTNLMESHRTQAQTSSNLQVPTPILKPVNQLSLPCTWKVNNVQLTGS